MRKQAKNSRRECFSFMVPLGPNSNLVAHIQYRNMDITSVKRQQLLRVAVITTLELNLLFWPSFFFFVLLQQLCYRYLGII